MFWTIVSNLKVYMGTMFGKGNIWNNEGPLTNLNHYSVYV